MDYSGIFISAKADFEKFSEFGFKESGGEFLLRRNIFGADFFAQIAISDGKITAEVFDSQTNEKYALFDSKAANGKFVLEMRSQVEKIIAEIREKCFESENLHKKYIDFLVQEFGTEPDFPWAKQNNSFNRYADYAVFRCPNKKWFALVMQISCKNLGFEERAGAEKIFAVNLKAESSRINEIADGKSIFPAYHMNKKHWITAILAKPADFETLCELTRKSYELVNSKKQKN